MSNSGIPDRRRYINVMEEAFSRLVDARTRGRIDVGGVIVEVRNGVWILDPSRLRGKPFTVIGDIHGDRPTFDTIMLQTTGSLRIFAGDYVDRGPYEEQVYVFYNLMRLFVEGEPIIPLRGNHEPPDWLPPHPHDFPDALRKVYGRNDGKLAYEASKRIFDNLPYALLIKNTALIVHAGPPTSISPQMDAIELLGGNEWPPRPDLLEEILWNDPDETVPKTKPNPRGAGKLWGVSITNQVVHKTRTSIIIRGHEPTGRGYKWNHRKKVLTLFSRVGKPYGNTIAAILYCTDPGILKQPDLIERECIRTLRQRAALTAYAI